MPDVRAIGPEAQSDLAARDELANRILLFARSLGFSEVGLAPAVRFGDAARRLERWLARGYHGDLDYLKGPGDRADPRALLADAKTIVVVALSYAPDSPPIPLRRSVEGEPLTGIVARYARGEDYHLVMKQKLEALRAECVRLVGRDVAARVCVDTAPLLEHEAARLAGVGFSAKSTLTIVPGLGSFVLLGELLLDVELPSTAPAQGGCGRCRACLDACPTGAFVDAHVLDARRCISYLTIEHQGPIPRELRAAIGTRVFGCDVCQDVCPFNASPSPRPRASELAPKRELEELDLVGLLELGAAGYRKLTKRTALRRVKASTLARNAAVALGNTGDARAAEPLSRALLGHKNAVVRSHAAWALGELGGRAGALGREALARALSEDPSSDVREEATLALERLG
jgi:epoxyqueuosine reductase